MKYNPYDYENPWRRNIEAVIVLVWSAGAFVYLLMAFMSDYPFGIMMLGFTLCTLAALSQVMPAKRLYDMHRRLVGHDLEFITREELYKIVQDKAHRGMIWLGWGYVWSTNEVQRLTQLEEHDEKELMKFVNGHRKRKAILAKLKKFDFKGALEVHKTFGQSIAEEMGQSWIHGVGDTEAPLWQKLDQANGHTFMVGTTGAGKTRMFDLSISQAVFRKEAVIIIDPKGDADLQKNAEMACKTIGKASQFRVFHLGFPHQSIHINPLKNYSNPEEIASRIAALLPQGPNSAPFTGFAWQAINTVVNAALLCTTSPSLRLIKKYLETDVDGFLTTTICKWMELSMGEATANAKINELRSKTHGKREDFLNALITNYRTKMRSHQAVDALISQYEHDREHFGKMITSILPILTKLTSGALGDLLSPADSENENVIDDFEDMRAIIQKGGVLYIGLDTLTNAEVGAAVGSMLLADLTAVAGDRYKFEDPKNAVAVNIFVDEANEVANLPMIQLLNKSRGAGFRMFVATQTYSDFVARLGNKDYANQVLGNLNNLIALRTLDPETQKFIISRMSKKKIKDVQRDQGVNTHVHAPILSGNSQRESMKLTEVDLFPTPALGKLPALEYVAVLSGGYVFKGRLPFLVQKKEK